MASVVYLSALTAVLLMVVRGISRLTLAQMRRRGLGTTRALVVGTGAGADALINRLEMFPEYGYELVGVVDDQLEKGSEYQRLPVVVPAEPESDLVLALQPVAGRDFPPLAACSLIGHRLQPLDGAPSQIHLQVAGSIESDACSKFAALPVNDGFQSLPITRAI